MPVHKVRGVLALISLVSAIFVFPGCDNAENKETGAKVQDAHAANDVLGNEPNGTPAVAVETPVPAVGVTPVVVPAEPVGISPMIPWVGPGFGGGGGGGGHGGHGNRCEEKEKKKHEHNYLLVWAADKGTDDGVQNSDFLAVIDADPKSKRFGEIVNTGPLPCIPNQNIINVLGLNSALGLPPNIPSCTYNESHHMSDLWHDADTNRDYIFTGGLISANIFRYDVTDPLNLPEATLHATAGTTSGTVTKFAVPDHMHFLGNGNLLVSYMGAHDLTTPGGLVEMSPKVPPYLGGFLAEYDAAQLLGPVRYAPTNTTPPRTDTGLEAHPHGLSLNHHLNLVIASDFVDPFSLATSDYPTVINFNFGTTVRLFDMDNLAAGPTKIIQVPNGPRVENTAPQYNISQEPEGLMHVDFLNKPEHKGAFTSSFTGGALFYCPDVTVPDPQFINVFDFGPQTGLSVFKITEDDNFLIMPVAGMVSPGDPLFDRDYPGEHARRVMVFDLRPLLKSGSGPIACGPPAVINDPITGYTIKMLGNNNQASDCPVPVSNLNVDSPLNFTTHGGPHMVETDPSSNYFVWNDYFVNLDSFNLPGSGSTGDLKVYLGILNEKNGKAVVDKKFRDELTGEVGVDFNRPLSYNWPNRGHTGSAKPHWSTFKRVLNCECDHH